MSIYSKPYNDALERIKNGTATPFDVKLVNMLTEIMGKEHYPLFTPSGKYLGLGAIKPPKLRDFKCPQ